MRSASYRCRIIPQTWEDQEMGLCGIVPSWYDGSIFLSGHLLAGWDATVPGVRAQALCGGKAPTQRLRCVGAKLPRGAFPPRAGRAWACVGVAACAWEAVCW
ncbi:MAG TPA: hypothetical protein VH599_14280 [Ktedonobacterales bacterium]